MRLLCHNPQGDSIWADPVALGPDGLVRTKTPAAGEKSAAACRGAFLSGAEGLALSQGLAFLTRDSGPVMFNRGCT